MITYYKSMSVELSKYPPESRSIWQEGAEVGCFESANKLYYYYLAVVEQGAFSKQQEEELYQHIAFYKARAKELMFKGLHWGGGYPPNNCYQDYQKKMGNIGPVDENSICLSKEEDQQLLIEFAKKGDFDSFDSLVSRVYPKQRTFEYKFTHYFYNGFAHNLYGGSLKDFRSTFPPELRTLYDKAIAANNERGWARHGYMESIEKWEKLFQDEGMKSLYKQAGN